MPGSGWGDAPLLPSWRFDYKLVAQGVSEDGSAFAVVQFPDFQAQLPTFGTHYPIRFLPLLFARGEGGGPPSAAAGGSLHPDGAGSLALDLSAGNAWKLEYWNTTAPSSGAARVRRRRAAAAVVATAAAAAWALLL